MARLLPMSFTQQQHATICRARSKMFHKVKDPNFPNHSIDGMPLLSFFSSWIQKYHRISKNHKRSSKIIKNPLPHGYPMLSSACNRFYQRNYNRHVAASSFGSLNDLLRVEDRQDDTGSAVESHGSLMRSCFYWTYDDLSLENY